MDSRAELAGPITDRAKLAHRPDPTPPGMDRGITCPGQQEQLAELLAHLT
jgi:hypothetical protein